MNFTDPTVIMFSVYLFAMLFIGFLGYRSTNNLDDYILGGRSLGSFVTALSAGASDMSGWLLMGLPGVAYFTGAADPMWTAIGLALGTYLNWKLVARRLRRYSVVAGDAITIPDFFSKRFHDDRNIVSTIAALIILVFFCVYVGSCFVTVGKLFSTLFGWDYHLTMVIGAAIVLGMTVMGPSPASASRAAWCDEGEMMLSTWRATVSVMLRSAELPGSSASTSLDGSRPVTNLWYRGVPQPKGRWIGHCVCQKNVWIVWTTGMPSSWAAATAAAAMPNSEWMCMS